MLSPLPLIITEVGRQLSFHVQTPTTALSLTLHVSFVASKTDYVILVLLDDYAKHAQSV